MEEPMEEAQAAEQQTPLNEVVAKEEPVKRKTLVVQFGPIHANNANMFRALNMAVFPVRYNEKFYQDVPLFPHEYTMYAWYGEFVVGAICCRRENNTSEDENAQPKRLYIMTLGVLAAWRGRGIGGQLLQKVLDAAVKEEALDHIYLHVQTSNNAALAFYSKFGFENVGMIENYYNRIEPPDCYILRKSLSGAAWTAPDNTEQNTKIVDESSEEKALEETADRGVPE